MSVARGTLFQVGNDRLTVTAALGDLIAEGASGEQIDLVGTRHSGASAGSEPDSSATTSPTGA